MLHMITIQKMYDELSYAELQQHIANGAYIRWCGMVKKGYILVQLVENEERYLITVNVDNVLKRWLRRGILRNGEAINPRSDIGFIPPSNDPFTDCKKATVLGINISGNCTVGNAKIYKEVEGCTCGYDIELDLRGEERGGFPLPSTPILSIALWCTCGFKYFISTMNLNLDYCYTTTDQHNLVSKFLDVVREHEPLWLVGWNCYSFDNTCLVYHGSENSRIPFRKVKIGSANTVDYGFILDIPGVFNVDPYGYMQRNAAMTKEYTDLSLYGVAAKMGTTMKTEMPDLYTVTDPLEIVEYNMNDSVIAAEIWLKTDLVRMIPSLAVSSSSHVYDCIRHMTSVTARCPYTVEALSINKVIDWSHCEPLDGYIGGKVFEPIKGVHDDVVVCDFSSMYPTIMVGANISPETIEVLEADDHEYGNVWFDSEYTYVRLQDCVTRFLSVAPSAIRNVLIKFVQLRNENKKSNPIYANTLKVVANSIYGAIGYENSPMYSPLCSSSVTAIGRWCLELACSVFETNGLKVIYGDTDSCFVSATDITCNSYNGDVKKHATTCITKLKDLFLKTHLHEMNMSLESYHKRVLLLEKKKYCITNNDGTVTYKGMSIVRRDTLGICKTACREITHSILYSQTMQERTNKIAAFIDDTVYKVINKQLSHSEVSKIAKRNQKRCYVYTGDDGQEKYTPVDMSHNIVPNYSVSHMLTTLQHEILRITVPCGLGTVYNILERSDIFI